MTIHEGTRARIVVVSLDDPLAPPLVELRLPPGGNWTCWSPDGRSYWPERGAWEEVVGFNQHQLLYPTWTRDGRSYCGLAWEKSRIECYSFATRRFETLAEIGDNPFFTAGWLMVPWFGLDADDNPLVVFDRSTRDLYALDWETP